MSLFQTAAQAARLNTSSFLVLPVPELRTFFRHCPSCGRRFEIRLVSKEEVGESEHDEDLLRVTGVPEPAPRPLLLEDTSPVTVEMEEFQYRYRCKHCGHEWSEIHEKTEVGRRPESYMGD